MLIVFQNMNRMKDRNQFATKGKWAKIMDKIEQNAMGEEAGKEFDKGRREFRETFAIG